MCWPSKSQESLVGRGLKMMKPNIIKVGDQEESKHFPQLPMPLECSVSVTAQPTPLAWFSLTMNCSSCNNKEEV